MMKANSEYQWGAVLAFAGLHVAALGVLFVPWTWGSAALLAFTYFLRMFGVTAGYHRYFSHRSYRLGRVSQFLMAFLAQTSGQKGALWWAAHHRVHHRESDRERDIHSPWQQGFWWSHVGWVLSNEHDGFDERAMADFTKFPELVWLNRYHLVPTVVFAAAILALTGGPDFFWGYVASTVVLYHCTFSINSVGHIWGGRRFDTPDYSRNNALLAVITMGEGWHNNHHFSPGSCRQGLRWWEVDTTWYLLKAFSWVGLTRNLRPFRKLESAPKLESE